MKLREFVYIGEPIPKINPSEHQEFLLNFQNAMLQSLAERNLITKNQTERVLDKLTMRSSYK